MKTPVFLMYGIITINLIIAVFIIGGLGNALSIIEDAPIIYFTAISSLYMIGRYMVMWMNQLINEFEEFSILIGIIGLFSILIGSIFSGATIGFLMELPNKDETNFGQLLKDYYFYPFVLILLFGCIPTTITGGFLGYLLKMDAKN